MIRVSKNCVILFIFFLINAVTCDLLDSERSSFFGLSNEVTISSSTYDLVLQLTEAVMKKTAGDRRVRRYFQRYDTPFIGPGRRSG